MTRSDWVTVRLPGARTAPATSTRMWFQTRPEKHGRKIASQDMRIAGAGEAAEMESVRSGVIGVLESRSPNRARVPGSRRGQRSSSSTPREMRKVELSGEPGKGHTKSGGLFRVGRGGDRDFEAPQERYPDSAPSNHPASTEDLYSDGRCCRVGPPGSPRPMPIFEIQGRPENGPMKEFERLLH